MGLRGGAGLNADRQRHSWLRLLAPPGSPSLTFAAPVLSLFLLSSPLLCSPCARVPRRRLSQAWVRGGFDEERLERQRMRQEELEREARQMSFMRGIRDAAQARRKAAQEQANGAGWGLQGGPVAPTRVGPPQHAAPWQ